MQNSIRMIARTAGLLVAVTLSSGVGQALAAADKPVSGINLDACQKAMSVLGASMGHTEVKAKDGRPLFRFWLRTTGLDYTADCDAATGSVVDVAPRLANPDRGAS